MRPTTRASHHSWGLVWALALSVATTGLVLAKSDGTTTNNNQQALKQQEQQQQASQLAAGKQSIDSQQQASQAHALKSVHQQQQVAEKKQGDQVVDSLFNGEEYVQIKPEEISSATGDSKDIDPALLALADLPNGEGAAASGSPSGGSPVSSSQQQASASQPRQLPAEHKSAADDELSAHLAQDTIGALESGPRPYAAPAADQRAARPHGPSARGGYMPPRRPGAQYHPRPPPPPRGYGGPRPGPRRPMGHGMPPPPPPPGYGREPRGPPPPPPPMGGRYPGPQLPGTGGYMSLKGKLADGLSSMVPHAPRPMHYGAGGPPSGPQQPAGYQGAGPMQPPSRYLPRGAAAGYAAFREFVRAQASRYKGQQPQQPMGSHEPAAYNAAPPSSGSSYGMAQGSVEMMGGSAYRQNNGAESKPYSGEAPAKAPAAPEAPAADTEQYNKAPAAPAAAAPAPAKSKVTVAQAYIPHIAPATGGSQAAGGYGGQASSSASSGSYATNPTLAKLYGGHAPQGVGRPEYNKDYGMVIHYPQATVYTEPMTVDQLHKLAGSSITQILEQLQHNLASGQRNEGNTIRANNKHHLGHGLAIHAKEYYAPGKGGHYVPTTAAVISSHEPSPSGESAGQNQAYGQNQGSSAAQAPAYSSEVPQAPQGYFQAAQNAEAAQYGLKPELGQGYERVKAAAAASVMKYGPARPMGGEYQQQQQQQQQQYRQPPQHELPGGMSLMKPYEPLGALANIIGSELESLYNKANSVLAKQIDPEIHAHVQAHLKTLAKVTGPLKFSEHDHRSPLVLRPHSGGQSYGPPPPPPPQQQHGQYQGPPRSPHQPPPPPPHHRGRAPRRPMGYEGPAPAGAYRPAPGGRYPPPPHHQMRPHQQRPGGYNQQQQHHHHQQQQQQQAYNAAEQQAFQQQMNQLLNDFNLGEDNYGAKSQPIQATNQGYPSKVMQKYQQQPQQQYQPQQQQQSAFPYEHSDGLEIPQGPNDQIGEISELIDALKGTLEGHKPEGQGANYQASKDGKIEDVQYIASALGQMPSYALQVPVGQQQQQQQHPQPQLSGESAVYEAAKKAEQQQYSAPGYEQQPQQQQPYQQQPQQQHPQQQQQPQGYQQQSGHQAYKQMAAPAELPYLAPPAPVAPASGYESAAAGDSQANGGYQQQQQHQPQPSQDYSQQQQPQQASAYGQYKQAEVAPQQLGYGGQASAGPVEAYGAQQQPQQQPSQQDSYSSSAQSAPMAAEYGKGASEHGQSEQAAPANYGPSSSAGPYQQQQQQPAGEQANQHHQPQQSSYSSSEHTQVINHLVPAQQHGAAASDYSSQQQHSQQQQQQQPQPIAAITTSITHQPANQISVAAPTESQYQSAQPLSSFVESLPSDYQELLRQPAAHASIMESIAGGGGGHSEPLYTNATSSDIVKTAMVPVPSSSVANPSPVGQPSASSSSSNHHHSHNHHHHQRLNRQYDSHHLTSSASSPKATYLQVPSASSSGASSTGSKPASISSITSSISTSITSSSSSSSPTSSSSSSSVSSPVASSKASSGGLSTSQQDTK